MLTVLASAGAAQRDVARLTIYIKVGSSIEAGFAASQRVWGPYPTAITVLEVAGFGRPDVLVEIEALAQVSAARGASST